MTVYLLYGIYPTSEEKLLGIYENRQLIEEDVPKYKEKSWYFCTYEIREWQVRTCPVDIYKGDL